MLVAAALSFASGFAQFGVFAALPDVAAAFGQQAGGASVAARVGLSGALLGGGLAVVRLSGLGALPLSGLADRVGRRRVLLATLTFGLAATAAAALSPAYWVFIALAALARPALSTSNAVCGVIAAEETSSAERAKAVALLTAGYGLGAGFTSGVRAIGEEALGFRGLFALALVPLLAVVVLKRWIPETVRFRRLAHSRARSRSAGPRRLLAALPRAYRSRLLLIAVLSFAISFVTGPLNGLLIVYAERVLGLSRDAIFVISVLTGVCGASGLLLGRWAADRFGRRPTAAVLQVFVALAGAGAYNFTGVEPAVGAYLCSALLGSAYGPAFGALALESFPTSARATSAGWTSVAGVLGASVGLLTFGLAADALGFGGAALVVSLPLVAATPLLARLPETAGLELEDSAPEEPQSPAKA